MAGAYVLLDRAALHYNLGQVRIHAPAAKIMAVIKANAYGHGLIAIANALAGADAFAVARIEEGVRLRDAGCSKAITVLQGFTSDEELASLLDYQLDTVIHSALQLVLLQNRPETGRLGVWLKIDTGMNRLGFKVDTVAESYHQLQQCRVVRQPIGLMTHLANADIRQDQYTLFQIGMFNQATQAYAAPRSIANSAGLLAWKESVAEWVRPGVMLYGISPFPDKTGQSLGLRPVMSLHAKLIAVKTINKGESLGYGGSWCCEDNTSVGIIAIGYGDGYPRYARTGTPVLVNGLRVPLIGRVSMDMITVNLATQPGARPDDPAILWGPGLPVEEVAQNSDTIPYTLVCGVTQRVRFIET